MRRGIARTLHSLARWINPKSAPDALTGRQWTGTNFVDSYKRTREPSPNELLAELKNTAWSCASLNASHCAIYYPRLFVITNPGQSAPKCATKSLNRRTELALRKSTHISTRIKRATRIEEVTDHPILDLFEQVNLVHNAWDPWELTTLYQEVLGSCYWYLSFDGLGVPKEIWVLPSQNVTPKRRPGSRNIVDYYEYRTGIHTQQFSPETIVHFRYPDPRDPYLSGLSPLRACYENIALDSEYTAFKKATWENNALPGAIISPDEVIGEEERDRLEQQWNAKFRRGGTGRTLIAESGMKVSILSHSMGDLAALAEKGANKEDIANAFHVPLSYFTKDTNLANFEAAEYQHLTTAITPRLMRRDEKINEQLIPLFDDSGRLFVASQDPMGHDTDDDTVRLEIDLKYGVVSINELRGERGLPPVPWGNVPWLPDRWLPTDQLRTWHSDDPETVDDSGVDTGLRQTE
jgi:HK97 family phage portal protein